MTLLRPLICIAAAVFYCLFPLFSFAQHLQPGMDHRELVDAFLVNSITCATKPDELIGKNYVAPPPKQYERIYRSEEIGFSNLWEFWINKEDSVGIISIRGTVGTDPSVAADFYAGMIPAKGEIVVDVKDTMRYKLAEHPRASVHAGFLIASLFIAEEMLPMLKAYYDKGFHDFLLIGHSQGGAITYMLTANLWHLQRDKKLPEDIQFKTYSVASPKPGNLFFAYDYEMLTQNGWAYNVVNVRDWVPQVPISIQTLSDFSEANPFTDGKYLLKKLKFPANIFSTSIYNKFDRPSKKAARNYEKFLGHKYKTLLKELNIKINVDDFAGNNNYQRAGNTWCISPPSDFLEKFPTDEITKYFPYHLHKHYLYVLDSTKLIPPKK